MQPVELRVALDQLVEGRHQVVADPGHGGIEPHRGGAHAVVAPVGRGHLELRVVEHRASLLVDLGGAAAELGDGRGLALPGVREHVHPGMHPQTPSVGALDELGERVPAVGQLQQPVGRGVGMARVEPGTASAIDLHEEVRRAQARGVLEQHGDAVGVLEHALGALGEHPERATRALGGALATGRRVRGGRRDVGLATAAEQARQQDPQSNPTHSQSARRLTEFPLVDSRHTSRTLPTRGVIER